MNAIAPGAIDNQMVPSLESQFSPENPAAIATGLTAQIALGRYGTNEEVAHLAVFLGSDESSYCTGSVFLMDLKRAWNRVRLGGAIVACSNVETDEDANFCKRLRKRVGRCRQPTDTQSLEGNSKSINLN